MPFSGSEDNLGDAWSIKNLNSKVSLATPKSHSLVSGYKIKFNQQADFNTFEQNRKVNQWFFAARETKSPAASGYQQD